MSSFQSMVPQAMCPPAPLATPLRINQSDQHLMQYPKSVIASLLKRREYTLIYA